MKKLLLASSLVAISFLSIANAAKTAETKASTKQENTAKKAKETAKIDAKKEKAIRELITELGFEKDMKRGSDMILEARRKMMEATLTGEEAVKKFKEQGAKDKDIKELKAVLTKFFNDSEKVAKEAIKGNIDSIVVFYNDNFSAEEITKLIEINKDSVSKKNREKLREYQPKIISESIKATESKIMPIATEFSQNIEKILGRFQKPANAATGQAKPAPAA